MTVDYWRGTAFCLVRRYASRAGRSGGRAGSDTGCPALRTWSGRSPRSRIWCD